MCTRIPYLAPISCILRSFNDHYYSHPWHLLRLSNHHKYSEEMPKLSTISCSTQLPVLILGSGLGGLTLAHSLAKHHIPYVIYERDSAASQ